MTNHQKPSGKNEEEIEHDEEKAEEGEGEEEGIKNNEKRAQIIIVINYFLILLLIFGIVYALYANLPVIKNLSDPSFARGLITFIIALATIGLAFIMVFQSFSGMATDNSFRRAREVFAGLMGVLGTIVGFYFGSSEKPSAPLEVAAVKFAEKQLITYAAGGSHPYHYSITSTDKNFKSINGNSEEGWIVAILEQTPIPGSQITVSVTDNKEVKASRKIDFPAKVAE